MTSSHQMEPKEAYTIAPGHMVLYRSGDGGDILCLKAERAGKEYVHHYLVQLDPVPADGYRLIYVDPEQALVDCALRPAFTLNDPAEPDHINRSDVGYIIETAAGLFLKVTEDPKMQKFCGYVNINTGEIKRRQERDVTAFYCNWHTEDAAGASDMVIEHIRKIRAGT